MLVDTSSKLELPGYIQDISFLQRIKATLSVRKATQLSIVTERWQLVWGEQIPTSLLLAWGLRTPKIASLHPRAESPPLWPAQFVTGIISRLTGPWNLPHAHLTVSIIAQVADLACS